MVICYVVSTTVSSSKTRISVRELMKNENKTKLNAFLRAWKRIQELPPDNPNSFWAIAGFHGYPPKPNQVDPDSKTEPGGFCQHGNVLFPMWHRFYVLRLEQALQAVCPEDDISMCYWDQTSDDTLAYGIPSILTDEKVFIDGVEHENPLKSYVLPKILGNNENDEAWKPEGYRTERYPYAGFMDEKDRVETAKHNSWISQKFGSHEQLVNEMNRHVKRWLKEDVRNGAATNTYDKFVSCLATKSYNVFSNKTSAFEKVGHSLETPHDDMHLSIGGGFHDITIQGASGDMAFVENAAFDPIFFFHHCNIDRVFWMWQLKNNCTQELEITHDDKGAFVSDLDPTPFQKPHQKLTMTTHLNPFQLANGLPATPMDGVDIAKLNYQYSEGSLMNIVNENRVTASLQASSGRNDFDVIREKDANSRLLLDSRVVEVGQDFVDSISDELQESFNHHLYSWFVQINLPDAKLVKGSFVVSLFWKNPQTASDDVIFIGNFSVFRRWNEDSCSNCQLRPRGKNLQFDITKLVSKHGRSENLRAENFSLQTQHFDSTASAADINDTIRRSGIRILRVVSGGYENISSDGGDC